MGYRMMGRGHAALMLAGQRLRREGGQGTVEYVALILLVAAVMAAVVSVGRKGTDGTTIAGKVTSALKESIDSVGAKK